MLFFILAFFHRPLQLELLNGSGSQVPEAGWENQVEDPPVAGQLFSHKRITHLDLLVGAFLSLDLRMRVLCGNARRLNVI